MSRPFHHILRLSGSGNTVVSEVLEASGQGEVAAWLVRAEVGSGATALGATLADHLRTYEGRTNPPAEARVAEETGITLTPSATEASFRTAFVNPIPFQDGLRFVGSVTATGGFVLYVSVWGELA